MVSVVVRTTGVKWFGWVWVDAYVGRMPRRRGISGPPRSYLVSGEWPSGRVVGPAPARYAQLLSRRLAGAVGSRPLREVAADAGVHHTSLSDLLAGEVWPDLVTVSRLEVALGVLLWPGDELLERGREKGAE